MYALRFTAVCYILHHYSYRSKEYENRKCDHWGTNKLVNTTHKWQKSLSLSNPKILSNLKDNDIVFEEGNLTGHRHKDLNSFMEVGAHLDFKVRLHSELKHIGPRHCLR